MNDRRDFDEGHKLCEIRRFGGGLLRLALHYFEPSDEPGKRVPWIDLSGKKDAASPWKRVTIKPRELRALAGALLAAADRLEAEGFALGASAPPEQNRTELAREHFARQPKPGARRA